MKRVSLLLILLSFVMISCKDDDNSVNTGNSGGILPTTIGSYWIYDNYSVDSNLVKTKLSGYDSIYVAGTRTILDKQAAVFVTISKNAKGVKTDSTEQYFAVENEKIYAHSSSILSGFNFGAVGADSLLKIPDTWMKVADKNDEDWKSLTFNIEPTQFQGLPISGSVTINGLKGTTKNFTVNGKTLNTTEYISNVNITLTITAQGFPLTFEIKRVIHYYFADGVGLVDMYNEPTKLPGLLQMFMSSIPGSDQVLTNYSIK